MEDNENTLMKKSDILSVPTGYDLGVVYQCRKENAEWVEYY